MGRALGAAPATAVNVDHGAVIVSAGRAAFTPEVMSGSVNAIAQMGNEIIAAGTFRRSGRRSVARTSPGTTTHRLYYTLSPDSRLYYRYFTPESQVVGAQTFVAASNGVDFSKVTGMTLGRRGDPLRLLHRRSIALGVLLRRHGERLTLGRQLGRFRNNRAMFVPNS